MAGALDDVETGVVGETILLVGDTAYCLVGAATYSAADGPLLGPIFSTLGFLAVAISATSPVAGLAPCGALSLK